MDFAAPRILWLIALAPLISAAVLLAARRRRGGWRAIARPGRPPADGGVAWVLAMVLLVVALAQPRWGRGPDRELPPGRDVVLMVDVSWSMAAEDVIPNRLGRASEAAEALTRALGRDPGDRIAVVAFAGRGVTRCPLTTNLGAVVEALRSLKVGGIEPGGTDLGAGLDASLDALGDEPRSGGRIIVVLSDGEDQMPDWPSRVDRLRARGVVVHTVAIGDAERGHPIPIDPRASGEPGLLAEGGEVVETRRVDLELRGLALATGGAFVPIGVASADLADLYTRRISPAEREVREGRAPIDRVERFGLFLLAGLAVGLVGSWPRRRRATRARPWWTSWMLLGLASTMIGAGDGGRDSASRLIDQGRSAFASGDLDTALDRFERASSLAPGDPIPPYNAAATLYQLGRFEESRSRYQLARANARPGLRTKIDYALGNVAVALRDIPSALRSYDDCLGSTVPGVAFDRIRSFAQDNRAFAETLANPGASTEDGDDLEQPAGGGGGDGNGDDGQPGAGDEGRDPPAGPDGGPGPSPADPQSGPAGDPGGGDPGDPGAAPGTGSASGRPPRGDSPADRLASAIESIRDARDRRLPDAPPVPPAGASGRPQW